MSTILPTSTLPTLPQSVLDLHNRVVAGHGRPVNDDKRMFHFAMSEDDRIRWPLFAQASDVWVIYATKPGGK